MMRVAGKDWFLEDMVLKERLLRDRPWVAGLVKVGSKDAKVTIFRVAQGEAWFLMMEYTMCEDQVLNVKL